VPAPIAWSILRRLILDISPSHALVKPLLAIYSPTSAANCSGWRDYTPHLASQGQTLNAPAERFRGRVSTPRLPRSADPGQAVRQSWFVPGRGHGKGQTPNRWPIPNSTGGAGDGGCRPRCQCRRRIHLPAREFHLKQRVTVRLSRERVRLGAAVLGAMPGRFTAGTVVIDSRQQVQQAVARLDARSRTS
jgi:hypothetical protein